MRILEAVPESVLWLGAWTEPTQANLRRETSTRGIDPRRLVFSEIVEHSAHLKRLGLADLALDTLHHGGGVTTVDCLWAGLPVLTTMGDTPPSRLGSTLNFAADMPEMIAPDLEVYEHRAVHLAQNPDALREIRKKLWNQRLTFPLFDTERYVRHLETGYALMWRNHLDGNRSRHFRIEV